MLLLKFLQTKAKVRSMNTINYDVYKTVSKNRNENEVVYDEYKHKETDFKNFSDNVTPNHFIGINNNDVMLRWRKLGICVNHFKYFLLYK